MEFKGTKGNWTQKHGDVYSDIQEGDDAICDVYKYNTEEGEANALLISKAPEMLEMLKQISKTAEKIWEIEQDSPFFDEIDFAEIDDLIKEATELK
ncbi:hypothetical protein EG346_16960 [Chryseobacterium carnipullorum]|uniref:Uncharacterized protein n=1 Tax=Chryseobacterium carnipullorum TaxID=1124835 RepID=A0A376DW75_CHRCU|nr:hypothetical protein [Chryseobacterium carnipullorum]AZA49765.1 hypothetical protein EG346_16960 [Chryseobacterium carnipullorum]AZA64657.1 hypothetical protein EG345_07990 [Chryseobacterium carnipullorum]STC95643.1 Uncharacterised protein [Chryseobacterium carnipullorum]